MSRRTVPAVLLGLLLLGGCSAFSGSDSSGGATTSSSAGISDGAPVEGTEELGPDGGAAAVADVDDAARQVVTEGSVTLTVESPRRAAQDAAALAEQAGGRVQERVEVAGQGSDEDTARLVVRVPADGLTRVLQELERLGRVDSVELTSDDVTGQAQDLDARIRALQISVTRLQDLLARAESTADVVAAEQTLTERQSSLESLQSQRARLADQVELSTLQLFFQTQEAAPPPARAGFGGGLVTGWESLVAALSVGLLVLGVLVPWLVVAAVAAVAVVAVRRELRRRRSEPRHSEPVAPAGT
jgi:hypothetical protein